MYLSKTSQPPDTFSCSAPNLDIGQLKDWARQAGQIALRYFNKIDTVYHKPDKTLLTQADLEIEYFLTERIQAAYPDHGLIGEEGSRIKHTQPSSYVWVIDPLDGTTVFSQGLPGWGISIGLLQHGKPAFGLFYMPLLNDITYTVDLDKVHCNGQILRKTVQSKWGQKGFLATTASAHHKFQIKLRRTRALGSVGASLIYTARGIATVAFLPKSYLWDLVAGAAILSRAGGEIRYLSGHRVDYRQLLNGQSPAEPIIAGNPQLLTALQRMIRPHTPGVVHV